MRNTWSRIVAVPKTVPVTCNRASLRHVMASLLLASIVALAADMKTIDTTHGHACLPIKVEQSRPHYGFSGVHHIPALGAWWYELPKSASTTVAHLLGVRQGTIDYPSSGPQPGDVGFTVVRHPTCRAISGFGTAWRRAYFRTNSTGSACPFSKFPYLLDNSSSLDERLSRALGVLEQHGSSLASGACGFAYHHMLSQTYFLWDGRRKALFDTEAARPPPPTVVLRLESLREDFERFCIAAGYSSVPSAPRKIPMHLMAGPCGTTLILHTFGTVYMSGLCHRALCVPHHHQAPSATPPSSASACYAVTARCRARMRLPTASRRHSQRVAATLLSYRRLRYTGSNATTSATLRVSVTRTAAARYSATRYSEPGEARTSHRATTRRPGLVRRSQPAGYRHFPGDRQGPDRALQGQCTAAARYRTVRHTQAYKCKGVKAKAKAKFGLLHLERCRYPQRTSVAQGVTRTAAEGIYYHPLCRH